MSANPPTVLARILEETRAEVERRRRVAGPGPAGRPERPRQRRSFRDAIAGEGIAVIAEFKRRSPSAGELAAAPDIGAVVGAYERGGAAAVSVLTEGPNFGGELSDLQTAGEACGLPLLRKDFIVDPFQLGESVAAGADAVLLIVAGLEQEQLAALHEQALDLGLDPLVEVHDERELERALEAGAAIVGINNRDLRDFTVDVTRTERLLGEVPAGVLVVSESGISDPEQLERLRERGVDAVLVGEALMRARDPAAALSRLRGFMPAERDL
jgi:indole-3-glycerol phosphate synthase